MRVNGEEVVLKEEIRLSDFLQQNGYNPVRIAVELNEKILPKAMYEECMLKDTDILELSLIHISEPTRH